MSVAKASKATKPAGRTPLVRQPAGGWWEHALAVPPRKAWVYERTDKPRADGLPAVYVRQWSPELGNWQKESLKTTLYTLQGRRLAGSDLTAAKADARVAALAVMARWEAERLGVVPDPAPSPAKALTIAETAAVITDPATGKYPHDTPYRRELLRSLAFTAQTWGASMAWNAVGKAQLRQLGRARVDELRARGKRGLRPAEITVGGIIAVATWLRDEDKIDEKAALPSSDWKVKLAEYWSACEDGRPYQVSRPRHTVDESRAILAIAGQVDPRLDLLLLIGAELRAGQVERGRRTDLVVLPDGTPTRIVIHSRGKKKGTAVVFTPGQRLAVRAALATGYLRHLEAAYQAGTLSDYRLFPSGPLRGGRLMQDPVALVETHDVDAVLAKTALLDWFHDAETLAGVKPVAGRAFYGIRRVAVDDALQQRISKHGLKMLGGWADTQIPDTVYADQESIEHLQEATDARARFRGETSAPGTAIPTVTTTPDRPASVTNGTPDRVTEEG